jgi:hypothetical protein
MNFTRVTGVYIAMYVLLNDAIGRSKLRGVSRPITSTDKSDVRMHNLVKL